MAVHTSLRSPGRSAAGAADPVGPRSEVTLPIRRRVTSSSVRRTVHLMYSGAALSVLAALVELSAHDSVRASLVAHNGAAGGRRLSAQEITDAAGFTVLFLVSAAAVSAVLWLVLAWAIAHGSHRARQVGTVLAVLCVLKVYGTLTQGGASALGVLIDLAQLCVAMAVTVLMWSKRSAAHFAPARAERPDLP